MVFFIYNVYRLFSGISYPALYLLLSYRKFKKKEHNERWKEKLGLYEVKRPDGKLTWLHVASVGELNSCIKLVEILLEKSNILITSGTLTSAETFAKINFKKTKFEIMHQFVPLDSPIIVKRFLTHFKPNVSCFAESEIWPNLLHEAAKISKVFSINTRISPKSLEKWKKHHVIFKWILTHFTLIIPYTKSLASELSKIIPQNICFLGNLKYDTEFKINPEKVNELKAGISGKTVVFGSTHEGEEEKLIPIFKEILAKNKEISGGNEEVSGNNKEALGENDNINIILIPRHPERATKIQALLSHQNIPSNIRTKNEPISNSSVYIANTMGEMAEFYQIADVIFMGGSIVETVGGHNIIEPAKTRKPIISGATYFNFTEIFEEFISQNAVLVLKPEEIAEQIFKILNDKEFAETLSQNAYNVSQGKAFIAQNFANLIENYASKS
jgi:3-deoxy-D-manno-octulosonic-acid transferase